MEEDKYKTIERITEGIYKEKGSKFMAFVYPVTSEEDIKEKVTMLKEKYYDARHHCYAYMLGADKKKFRTNDAGEPSSTAGRPILGQILSYDVTNVLIVVVRYFGGVKLGVSGLTNAYKEAAGDALRNAVIVERTINERVSVRFHYLALNDVMRIIKEEEPEVLERHFEMECKMTLSIRQSALPKLIARLDQVDSLTFLS